jgi:uncharacterized membrane protein YhaH (DUF805 family)
MEFTEAIIAVLNKYTDFNSRSLRSEYWGTGYYSP